MTDAFIYDHVRTPRGRGKPDGSLHEVSTLSLATCALEAIRDRNDLDTGLVDDVVLGCVDPVGEAGSDIARVAALRAGYGDSCPRHSDPALLRVRPRCGEFRRRRDHGGPARSHGRWRRRVR